MNHKVIIGTILVLTFVVCMGIGNYLYKINSLSNTKLEQITEVSEADEKISDECTKEAEELLQANSNGEQKVSPNAIFVIKRQYEVCGHTTKQYIDAPEDTVNKTEKELEEMYKDWEIEGFSNQEIVMKKKENGICNEHYVLRQEDEKIVVYQLDENNHETVFERTGILTKYLPETDRINIDNGIYVNGKEALNCLLEDYE